MFERKFKTVVDLVKSFPNEISCHQYLASQRWDSGEIICPHDNCGHNHCYVFSDGIRYKCKKCKTLFTAKTNTFMEASKLETIKWFMAMYLIMHKKGISSIQLSKDVGVTQKTAWFMLQRVRWALGNEDDGPLEGNVQLDETFVGGKNKNRHADKKVKQSQGRSFKDKTPVMGMLQEEIAEFVARPHKVILGKTVVEKVIISPSKVKCKVIPTTSGRHIQPIIRKTVKHGSTLISDEWHAYNGLWRQYNHQVVDHSKKQYVNDNGYTSNALEGFWTQCKLSIHAMYVRPTRKHLQKYFYEFAFRYNYRNLAVQEQIENIINNMVCRLKYKDLIE